MRKMNKIEVGKSINYGWGKVKKDMWYFVGLSFIYLVLTSFNTYFRNETANFYVSIFILILSAYLSGGFIKIFLSYYDDKKLAIIEIFKQSKYFWRMLGAQILLILIVFFGLLLLVVPGIVWLIKYQFVFSLIVDKDMGVLEAMKKSSEITKGIKWQLFWFNIVCLGVIILGVLVFGVGIFVAYPVIMLADTFVYRRLLTKLKSKIILKQSRIKSGLFLCLNV